MIAKPPPCVEVKVQRGRARVVNFQTIVVLLAGTERDVHQARASGVVRAAAARDSFQGEFRARIGVWERFVT